MDIHPAAAEGFANSADDYERARPSYPDDAVAHLVTALGIGPGATVADVAAGTGKLTRLLLPSGAQVLAVEPVEEMRGLLARTSSGAEVLDGTAEHLPLADGSVDAITVAQAFHWFDAPAALAEFGRVLAPGGGLGVVYNRRDNSAGWLTEINELIEQHRGDAPHHRRGEWRDAVEASGLFTAAEEVSFDNPQTLRPEEVVARFRSLSFVGALGGAEQGALLANIAHVLATNSETAGKTELVIPQQTTVYTCRRP